MIICIGREFGSGGHEIGKRLAESMKLPFYDRELVDMAIERSESIREAIEKADERKANAFLHSVWYETVDRDLRGMSANDILFKLQSEEIIELSQSGDGVFVGRCADYILKKEGVPHISVFVSAPFPDRVKRKMELLGKDEKTVQSLIRKIDKQRKAYYNYYTGRSWGKPDNYEFCINSSAQGIEQSVEVLQGVVRQRAEYGAAPGVRKEAGRQSDEGKNV